MCLSVCYMDPVFMCRLLMRMMNERGLAKRSLDSSLKDDQTAGRAQEIEMLRTGYEAWQCFKYVILLKPIPCCTP